MLIIIIAYLIGAIPTGYLAKKLLAKIWSEDSPRLAKFRPAIISMSSVLADGIKGMLLIIIISKLFLIISSHGMTILLAPFISMGLAHSIAIIVAVLAHVLSVHISGWGGKGSAVIIGGFLVLTPLATLYALIVCAVIGFFTRKLSYASFSTCCLLPVILYLCDCELVPVIAASIILAILSILTHSKLIYGQH